jgi:phage-related protein
VLSTVDGYVSRTAETVLGSVSNLASQGMAVIDKVAAPALEGMEQIKSTIRQLDPQGYINIVTDALQTSIGPTISNLAGAVDTVTGTLSASKAYGDLVNTLTDGKYSALFSNDSISEKITTVITKHTADLGLSGVFSSFVEKYGTTAGIVNAGSELLKHASGTGNASLLYEVATSAVGRTITELVPNATGLIASGTKLKAGTEESSFSQLFEKMRSALTAVDSRWDQLQSTTGTLLSTQKITPASADFKTVLTATVHQNTPVVSTTAVVLPLPSTSYIHAALSTPVAPIAEYFQEKYMVKLVQQTDLSPF